MIRLATLVRLLLFAVDMLQVLAVLLVLVRLPLLLVAGLLDGMGSKATLKVLPKTSYTTPQTTPGLESADEEPPPVPPTEQPMQLEPATK